MTRATSFALMIAFCVTAASAQAAGPKGKFGNHKPVAKTPSGGFNFGNVTNPIVNTPPKTVLGPINHLPVFPPRFPIEKGHGPVVFNPPHHGPINGLPVFPNKPPHKNWHHDHCNDWYRYLSMNCADDCCFYFGDDCSYDLCFDMCW
jgi:hypothetical protein